MSKFLDGVEQGGGLTAVADVTVSGGAVTEFGATGVNFVDGGVYEFTATVEQNGAGASSLGWLFDSDELGANYPQFDRIRTGAGGGPTNVSSYQTNSAWYPASMGYTVASGEVAKSTLKVRIEGTALKCLWEIGVESFSVATAGRLQFGRFTYDSGTLPTQIGVLSSLASGIANGSTIKGVRLY